MTHDDIRQIALGLPDVVEGDEGFGFGVLNKGKNRGICWAWKERIDPKKARIPNDTVVAVIVSSLSAKELLLASDEAKYFTEPHYNGYPAILVRLALVTKEEMEDLLVEAWRCTAPKSLVKEFNV